MTHALYFARRLGRRWLRIRISTALVPALILLSACDDGNAPDAVVHVVEVTPLQTQVLVGDTIQLTGRPKGPDGSVRQGVALEWSTRMPQFVTVEGSGNTARIVARRAGLAEVSAGALGKTGLATIEVQNRVPAVTSLQPATAVAGSGAFTLVVRGTNFSQDSRVLWNGQVRPTQHVNEQELRAFIPATDVGNAGVVQVGMENPAPGGGIATLEFTVTAAGASWVQMQPGAATIAVGANVTLSATPRDFLGNVVNETVTWSSASPHIANVSAAGVVTGVSAGVAIIRATSQGGATGTAAVTVEGPLVTVPVITSISPDSVDSNAAGLEITIRGTGFVPNSGTFLSSSGRPTTFVSATELRMHLWPGDLNTAATRQVTVFNPGLGGGMSTAVPFRIATGVWSVRIEPQHVALWPGQELQLVANAYDQHNNKLTGRQVTWESNNPSVMTVDANGRVRAIAHGSATIEAVIGGRRGYIGTEVFEVLPWDLLYEGTHGGWAELWLLTMGPDAAPRRILPVGTWATDPAASPDGARIVYVGLSVDGSRNLFSVNRNGSNLRQLTFEQEDDDQPAWSRDGTRIAFRSTRDGYSDIWVMNADGTGLFNVTKNASRSAGGRVAAERPSWTPDGRLVFSWGAEMLVPRPYRLVSVKPDGTDWKVLTHESWHMHEAEVSPSGSLIAVRRSSLQWGSSLDVISASGSDLGWINHPGPGNTPAWSPDSKWLTFSYSDGPGHSGVAIMSLNAMAGGLGQRRLVVPAGARNPVWIARN